MVIAALALAGGYFIQYKLRPYRILYPFTSEQRGWRDQAFEVALYSAIAAVALILMARLVRKI